MFQSKIDLMLFFSNSRRKFPCIKIFLYNPVSLKMYTVGEYVRIGNGGGDSSRGLIFFLLGHWGEGHFPANAPLVTGNAEIVRDAHMS